MSSDTVKSYIGILYLFSEYNFHLFLYWSSSDTFLSSDWVLSPALSNAVCTYETGYWAQPFPMQFEHMGSIGPHKYVVLKDFFYRCKPLRLNHVTLYSCVPILYLLFCIYSNIYNMVYKSMLIYLTKVTLIGEDVKKIPIITNLILMLSFSLIFFFYYDIRQ